MMLLALLVPLVLVLLSTGLVFAGLFVLLALFISFVTAHGAQQQRYNLTAALLHSTDCQNVHSCILKEQRHDAFISRYYMHSEMKQGQRPEVLRSSY